MTRTHALLTPLLLAVLAFPAALARGQSREEAAVRSATAVLNEIMAVPLEGIPRRMLADAQGIAIIPNVIKGSFIIGARHGKGVLLVRDEKGNWQAPVFVTLTGGNIGWQVGVQATDVILVFKTRQSVQGILSGKFTIGADAAAAAGPVGRQAAAATDARLKAEIYSYSRSRGLFAGVSVDGSVLRVDQFAGSAYYQSPGPGQPATVPESAIQLVNQVAAYCGAARPQANGEVGQQPVVAPAPAASQSDALRNQLAQVAPQLYQRLDPSWRAYLALPAEVFTGRGHPSAEVLDRSAAHFDVVAKDPRYRQLAEQPEFQSTYGLLRHYVGLRSQPRTALHLPPPPAESGAPGSRPARY